MKTYVNLKKNPYNTLGDFLHLEVDFRAVNTIFYFNEMYIKRSPDQSIIMCAMNLLGIDNLSDKVDKSLLPIPAVLMVHAKDVPYKIYSVSDNKRIEIVAPISEQLLFLALSELSENKFYRGKITIGDSVREDAVNDPELLALVNPVFVNEIDKSSILQSLTLEIKDNSNGNGNKSYSNSSAKQTELTRLDNRLEFLLRTSTQLFENETKNLDELYSFSVAYPEKYNFLKDIMQLLF
ncbi:MAG: hypothetical protein CV045_10625 [Cyanobacteria bacterium M5B4]|nr:MAG: hypothetical protein CV045_10625 [Cyanobacteria bacterium M5B4]